LRGSVPKNIAVARLSWLPYCQALRLATGWHRLTYVTSRLSKKHDSEVYVTIIIWKLLVN